MVKKGNCVANVGNKGVINIIFFWGYHTAVKTPVEYAFIARLPIHMPNLKPRKSTLVRQGCLCLGMF